MKRHLTLLEVLGYATLTLVGLYLLYRATADQQTEFLIGGTVGLTLGGMGIISAIRNILWRRHVQRREF